MIFLKPQDHDHLRQLVNAGDEGLPLSEIGAASAITLSLAGLVRITNGELAPQRVIATKEGAAHLARLSFA